MNRKLLWGLSSLALIVTLTACASGGGPSTADVPAAPAVVDYSNEVGDNGLLTPRAIFTRYVDALGGEKALRAHNSSITRGKMELPAMGIAGDLTIWAAAPNLFLMRAELGGMGAITTGYDGEVGYMENPMTGPMVLGGKELAQMLQQADFYGPLNWQQTFPEHETVELTEFNGTSAYKVRLVDTAGNEVIQYFAEDTGLLVGFEGTQSSQMGEMFVSTTVEEYKEFGDLKVATATTMNMMGTEIKQTIVEISFEELDSSVFELPDSIKALVD